jgi:hypothetical protein
MRRSGSLNETWEDFDTTAAIRSYVGALNHLVGFKFFLASAQRIIFRRFIAILHTEHERKLRPNRPKTIKWSPTGKSLIHPNKKRIKRKEERGKEQNRRRQQSVRNPPIRAIPSHELAIAVILERRSNG